MTKSPTILVVEDEPLVCEIVTIWLEDAGFTVVTACNADKALVLLSTCPAIDGLFTDIYMPGEDGIERNEITKIELVRVQEPPADPFAPLPLKPPAPSDPSAGKLFADSGNTGRAESL